MTRTNIYERYKMHRQRELLAKAVLGNYNGFEADYHAEETEWFLRHGYIVKTRNWYFARRYRITPAGQEYLNGLGQGW